MAEINEPEINVIDHKTLMFVKQTLIQCQDWLQVDAKYAHSSKNIKLVNMNVEQALSKLFISERKYSDNSNIINQFIRERNREAK